MCPFCSHLIGSTAVVCKHCGRDLPVVLRSFDYGDTIVCSWCSTSLWACAVVCKHCGRDILPVAQGRTLFVPGRARTPHLKAASVPAR